MVKFALGGGETWVGNFAKFEEGGETSVHTELGPQVVVVVAGGAGYLVDAESRHLIREMGFDIQRIWFDEMIQAMIVSNGLWFEAFNAETFVWRSRRISWDGIQNEKRSGETLTGEAFDPMTDCWLPFSLNLTTGEVQGGTYNGPEI